MPTTNLSNKTTGSLAPRPKTYVAYDTKLPGFGCRVTPSGAKSWIVEYRPGGGGRRVAKTRMTLGSVSALPADRARRAATEILARARLGQDVAAEKAARRKAATVEQLFERYMAEEIRPTRKPSTTIIYEMQFRRHVLPQIGKTRACDVTRSTIMRLHRSIGEHTQVTANRVVVLISGLYSWAASVGEIPDGLQPAKGVTRYREEGRERYLSGDELARLGNALRVAEQEGLPWHIDETKPTAKHAPRIENRRIKLSPFAVAAIKLLLLTGCRLREILHLQWKNVDFERGMLFLPDSKTGRKPVLLSLPAMTVLESLPRVGTYVIFGAHLNRPRHDLQRPWEAIVRYASLDGVRLHDLRHSFAATGAANGLGLLVIGKLLGHRNAETTARYAHLDSHPERRATNSIANELVGAMADPVTRAEAERFGELRGTGGQPESAR
jgi:integrase